jgi:hypothetical protein
MGFNILGKLFGGGAKNTDGSDNISSNENSISNQANLIQNIELILKKNYRGNNFMFDDRILRIWVIDGIQYDALRESSFKNDLIMHMDNLHGAIFAGVEVCSGPLPDQHGFTKVDEGIFLEVCRPEVHEKVLKAEITVLRNYGTLVEDRYVLDSSVIETMQLQRYNIGAGESPEVSGRFRCNHIAVDDRADSEGFERNKYVSRTHAYIRFNKSKGFMLQAEPEGTIKAGKRTRILRPDGFVEVDDIVPQPLMDGDCIELNKSVRLMFKIIS